MFIKVSAFFSLLYFFIMSDQRRWADPSDVPLKDAYLIVVFYEYFSLSSINYISTFYTSYAPSLIQFYTRRNILGFEGMTQS